MKIIRISTTLVTSLALATVGVSAAFATSGHGQGHTPVVVCHNVTHNPHIIIVDDDSTKLKAHLAHRTQPQLMDLVEGVDGTAQEVRAACLKTPPTTGTTQPTGSTTTSPTSTTTDPGSTTTTTTGSSTTSSTTSGDPSPTSRPTLNNPAPIIGIGSITNKTCAAIEYNFYDNSPRDIVTFRVLVNGKVTETLPDVQSEDFVRTLKLTSKVQTLRIEQRVDGQWYRVFTYNAPAKSCPVAHKGSPAKHIAVADPAANSDPVSANSTPTSLAYTGAESWIYSIAGLLLLGLGAFSTRLAQRKR